MFIRTPLHRSGKELTIMKVLPSGVYQYKFIVDGQWKHAPDLPWAQDDSASPYNILDLKVNKVSVLLQTTFGTHFIVLFFS